VKEWRWTGRLAGVNGVKGVNGVNRVGGMGWEEE
jgi:hypothetical protein